MKKIMRLLLLYLFKCLPSTRCFALKRVILRVCGLQVGANVRVCSSVRFIGANVRIGDNTWIGHETLLISSPDAGIRIGSNCDIAPQCLLLVGTHEIGGPDHRAGPGFVRSIKVGDGCWLGARSMVLAGASIGDGCVVAAGAVVRKEILPNALIAGVPARVLRLLGSPR